MGVSMIKPAILGFLVLVYWLCFGLGPSAEEFYVLIFFALLYALAGLVSVAVWPVAGYHLGAVYSGFWIFGFIFWYFRFLSRYEYSPTHFELFGFVVAIAMILAFGLVAASYLSRKCHEKIRRVRGSG